MYACFFSEGLFPLDLNWHGATKSSITITAYIDVLCNIFIHKILNGIEWIRRTHSAIIEHEMELKHTQHSPLTLTQSLAKNNVGIKATHLPIVQVAQFETFFPVFFFFVFFARFCTAPWRFYSVLFFLCNRWKPPQWMRCASSKRE